MFLKGYPTRWVWISILGGGIGGLLWLGLEGGLVTPRTEHLQAANTLPTGGSPQNPISSGDSFPNSHEDGQALLEQAILSLEARASVVGKIRYYFDLFSDPSITGSSTYAAQLTESGHLFYWELLLAFPNQPVRWWELFDGQTLWTYQSGGQEQKELLRRVDILQVAQHLKKQGNLPKIGEIGNWPGLGGLPKLLRSLLANFQFTLIEQTFLRVTDGQHTQQLPVWKLHGTWKPDRLATLLPNQAEQVQHERPVPWENVPPYIPDQVIVFLGQEDLFPYEIQYWRKPSGRWSNWLSQFAWLQARDRCLAKLEFVEVSLNLPLPPETFHYQPPPQLKPIDSTNQFIQQLEKKMKK